MTFEDFTVRMTSTYRDSKDDDMNDTFRKFLIEFDTHVTIRDYQKIYDYICQNYQYKTPPKPYLFWKFAKENGYVNSVKESSASWRVCENNHVYANVGSSCPVCGSTWFKLGLGDSMPTETILVNQMCSQCVWYEKSLSGDSFALYGPECQEYGTENRKKNRDICGRCKCADCCEMAYINDTNPELYRDRYVNIIKPMFKKLNEHIKNLSENNPDKFKSKRKQ